MLLQQANREASPESRSYIGHLRPQSRPRVAVLLNANAKRVNERVRAQFEAIVPRDDLFFSRSLEEGREIARTIIARRYDTVLAGGGDGTIVGAMNLLLNAANEGKTGLYRPPLPDVGVLRLGTGNGLGYATGAGKPLEDAMQIIAGQRPRARPLQLMEDRAGGDVFPFASLGYDAQLLNDYVSQWRATSNPMAQTVMKSVAGYFVALGTRTIPQQIRSGTPQIRLTALGRCSRIDPTTDEEVPLPAGSTLFEGGARTVMFGTTPYYGYKMKVFPYAERRSDRFQLRVSTAGIPYILANLPSIWDGTHRTDKFVDFLVEGVRFESSEAMPYQTAGDARGYRSDLEVQLSARTFRVLDRAAA